MTEAEWLGVLSPKSMVKYLGDKASARKLRLAACSIVSTLTPRAKLVPDVIRAALEEVERYADGTGTKAAMKRVRERMAATRASTPPHRTTADDFVCFAVEFAALEKGCMKAIEYAAGIWSWGSKVVEPPPYPDLIRDIFGNPFRPVALDRSWLTSTVAALAAGIYDDRAFDRMPILADALMDAGCDNDDVLNHCRGDGVHVRGCWVVDLLLGKE